MDRLTDYVLGQPAGDEVHLWRARLDVTSDQEVLLSATLTADEFARAARFRFARDRIRFVAARGHLRMLLGRYLDVSPRHIALCEGTHGKPALAVGPGWLRFNLSHSNGVAVYAVSRNREVGVDLEQIQADLPYDVIARHYFSAKERADLEGLPECDRLKAAFRFWTRKEAYLKALGAGFAAWPRDGFDLPAHGYKRSKLRRTGSGAVSSSGWSVYDFSAGPGFAAALAVEGSLGALPAAARQLELV